MSFSLRRVVVPNMGKKGPKIARYREQSKQTMFSRSSLLYVTLRIDMATKPQQQQQAPFPIQRINAGVRHSHSGHVFAFKEDRVEIFLSSAQASGTSIVSQQMPSR